MEKVTKRLTTEIMTTRVKVENFKQKLSLVQTKLLHEYDKYKQLEKELENVKITVSSAQSQKEQLAKLAKVEEYTIIKFVYFFTSAFTFPTHLRLQMNA